MKELKEILKEAALSFESFQVYRKSEDGKNRPVGMAYIRESQDMYTIRLWTFLNDRFYLIPTRDNPKNFLIMNRESNTASGAKRKYHWNIVGRGAADSAQSCVQLNFDLLGGPIYMSLFPETYRKINLT